MGWNLQKQRDWILLNAPRLGWDPRCCKELAWIQQKVRNLSSWYQFSFIHICNIHMSKVLFIILVYIWFSFSGKLRTSEEGADTVIWLALQPKEKLIPGAFYFDRAQAPKHLMLTATSGSHALIDSIIDSLRSLSAISS